MGDCMQKRRLCSVAPLPNRMAVGGALLYAGSRKLFLKVGHENIVHLLESMGMPAPEQLGWVVGLFEFSSGLALLTGTRTRTCAVVNSVFLAGNCLKAFSMGGFPDPLPGQQALPGYLSSFLGVGALSSLVISGAGELSIDERRGRCCNSPLRAAVAKSKS